MNVTDEALMAYADGEADDATRAAVEEAMRKDPAIAAQVAAQRELAARMRTALAAELDEPTPDRLIAAVLEGTAGPTASRPSNGPVIDLQSARARRGGRARWRMPAALAASLVAGIAVGMLFAQQRAPLVAAATRGVVAEGALARTLSTVLTGERAGAIDVGASFLAKDGPYCRSFRVATPTSAAGIACREDDAWRIRLWMDVPARPGASPGEDGGGYRPAGSEWPPAVLSAIESEAAGEPLDPKEEAAARARAWRAPAGVAHR